MSATNSPRPVNRPARTSQPDPNAIDLAWAIGRARNWLLGPAPLVANLSLFLFIGLGTLLWRLSQQPDGFGLPGWLVIWGVLIAVHAGIVVVYGTLHAWRTPRRGPVYYQDIPREQRTVSRRSVSAAQPSVRTAPVEVARPTWQGVLAPVTPFPTQQGADRFGTDRPAAPDQDDISARGLRTPRTAGNAGLAEDTSATAGRASALADVRDVLASEQPRWRRWRRGTTDRSELAEPPVDADSSWLSPFPGAPPVTRPAPATPPARDQDQAPAVPTRPATDQRWPASGPTGVTPVRAGQTADGEQIPSLAAMLRSSNLTSLADAPIAARPSQTSASDDATPIPLPSVPIPFSRPANPAGMQPHPAALFAAFGIDGDGTGPRIADPEPTTETSDFTQSPDIPPDAPREASTPPRRPGRP